MKRFSCYFRGTANQMFFTFDNTMKNEKSAKFSFCHFMKDNTLAVKFFIGYLTLQKMYSKVNSCSIID